MAAELISSQAMTTGNDSNVGSVAHGTAGDDDEPPAGEGAEDGEPSAEEGGADAKDPSRVDLSASVSSARPPQPPRRRVALAQGRVAQTTKRRRFQEMANAAGFDVDTRILDTMDWDKWTDGGDSSSGGVDEERP